MMGIVHAALKSDLSRARDVLADDPPPRGRQRVALGEHVSWMLEFLHGHHSGEDQGVWPLVRDRSPGASELPDSMEADHARIAPAADAAAKAAAEYTATATDAPRVALVGALDDLLAVLVPHLDREVAEAMPVVSASMSDREWKDIEQRYFLKSKSTKELAMEGHWMLEDIDPEGYDVVVHTVPPVLRFVLIYGFGPSYRRRAKVRWSPDVALDESAARRVERWALVAGVTGCTANGLLLALYTVGLPGDESYEWTGPANDAVGAVAALSMIPMTAGVCDLLGSPGRLPLLTRSVAVGGTASAASSALLLTGAISFPVQAVIGTGFGAVLLLWTEAVGRSAATRGVLPRRLARAARIIGGTGLGGMALAAAGAALPRGSRPRSAVAATGVAMGVAGFLALPAWQIMLSRAMSRRATYVSGPRRP
ncbi:MAG: hemerythrin domain-containing protein [Micrococcales bacterium]|nr:hemerythrin domain-containing protein [Micrococcales bacterium]